MEIRKYQETDWSQVWPIIKKVFRAGETYAFTPEITEQEAHNIWVELPKKTYVVTDQSNLILGTYYIKPNQPGLGSHVCNCGYIVPESARGKGAASIMCEFPLLLQLRHLLSIKSRWVVLYYSPS